LPTNTLYYVSIIITAESGSGDDDVILTKADMAAMTVDELRCELRQRVRLISGLNKTQLQAVLLQTLGQKTATMTTLSASQAEAIAPSTAQPSPPADSVRFVQKTVGGRRLGAPKARE